MREYAKGEFFFTRETDAHTGKGMVCADCHGEKPHSDGATNRHVARIACQTCHIPRTGGALAKDFTRWTQGADGFYEPTTLRKEANETTPVYAWYNRTVANTPAFIGPKGSRADKESRIHPFKMYQGKAYFDRKTGRLLSMDFAPPMAMGDTLREPPCAERGAQLHGAWLLQGRNPEADLLRDLFRPDVGEAERGVVIRNGRLPVVEAIGVTAFAVTPSPRPHRRPLRRRPAPGGYLGTTGDPMLIQ